MSDLVRVMQVWRQRSIGDWIFTTQEAEDTATFIMPNQDYEEMGKPGWITVIVEADPAYTRRS